MLLLAGVVGLGIFTKVRSKVPDLKIEFVSVTNSPAGHILATFSIKNPHPRAVDFMPGMLELEAPPGWTTAGTRRATGNQGRVQANGLTNCSVRVDVLTNSNWRVAFFAVFPPTRVEHWREVAKVNWRTFYEKGRWAGLSAGYPLNSATNYSDKFRVPFGF